MLSSSCLIHLSKVSGSSLVYENKKFNKRGSPTRSWMHRARTWLFLIMLMKLLNMFSLWCCLTWIITQIFLYETIEVVLHLIMWWWKLWLLFYSDTRDMEVDAWGSCSTCCNPSGPNVFPPRITALAVPKG